MIEQTLRKIIHVDMDCFYAAIEIRDNPALRNKPVAVGGSPEQRGVIATCNYIARKYGVHSAMATATAYRYCPHLIVLSGDMTKYRHAAQQIHSIFHEYSNLVEPLGLDEAYIDVSGSRHCQGSATLIAKEIRKKIWQAERLTASAGVAPNKFLAKIASGWNKPNGIYVIRPKDVAYFVKNLAVDALNGVGKVTAEKLHRLNLRTCEDLQKITLAELIDQFGRFGLSLYYQCRGIDDRPIKPDRIRKSLSVECTFPQDIPNIEAGLGYIHELYHRLMQRIQRSAADRPIKNQCIKIKFFDFKTITAETVSHEVNLQRYMLLLQEAYAKVNKPIRLLGMGVHFDCKTSTGNFMQRSLF